MVCSCLCSLDALDTHDGLQVHAFHDEVVRSVALVVDDGSTDGWDALHDDGGNGQSHVLQSEQRAFFYQCFFRG